MLHPAIEALLTLLEPLHLLALAAGVLIGLIFGLVPGLGGITGLALLLPFTYTMEPTTAIAMMLGLVSVTNTSDSIPAILFGVPGTSAAQATILEGYPMSKRGEAERALAVAFLASIVGTVIGAVVLALSIPVLRPFVLAFGAPEFFMMGLMGITMVTVLSTGSVLRGLLSAILGMLFAMVGTGPQSAFPRWTFDSIYLLDGISLIPLALGIFAIPEMIELYIKGGVFSGESASTGFGLIHRFRTAVHDVFRHWFLVLRSSAIGIWVGAIPGLGSSVVDWFAYGHAMVTERNAAETFGRGDIRGLIAPESANNGKTGGELIPTLAFGIPGTASMAIFLSAMLYHGLYPGVTMLTTNLDMTLAMVWSLPLANLLGGGLCFLLAGQMARVARLHSHYLIPILFVVVAFASYHTTKTIGDLLALAFFSLLGWGMKSGGWPRPPLVLAFVLTPILENYLFISLRRYGASWITQPSVLILAGLIAASLAYGFLTSQKSRTIQWKQEAGVDVRD